MAKYKLQPAYDFLTNPQRVLLNAQVPAVFSFKKSNYSGDAEIYLVLVPHPRIRIYGNMQAMEPETILAALETLEDNELSFQLNSHVIPGHLVDIDNSDEKVTRVEWTPKYEPIVVIGDESITINHVVFHLFNFSDFIGTRRSVENIETRHYGVEHLDLVGAGWKVELRSLAQTRDNIRLLRAEGGYRLTHIGCLKKADGRSFTAKQATIPLGVLKSILSFAKGSSCQPEIGVGLDNNDNRVWEYWSSPGGTWADQNSWFDRNHSKSLELLFPIFFERWDDEDWRSTLREVLYWYVNANNPSRGIDAGIILTQAAIELLAYQFAVRDRQLLTSEGFKNLWASDKFRLLFSSLKIPLSMPNEVPKMRALARQFNWLDTPHALTEIRNSLVHPEHKRKGQFSEALYEAWGLGLWALEMSILAICSYQGDYGNRLKSRWLGEVEAVPWKKA